ncbi:hypothetical protein DGI_1115 [Megalodesulfovibrio gigas DSM 1382 = ATCC 19364]|uniref:Uncharacterized protein n=1 Tax=Megalodesulfovibrio gigas (strain ATCC 19364 / DSM 1382 / NCIMB 9332 / VKM B-1759) TaxID=1121448 RepID=T2G9L9_MEGG1|nr:hypothetical protein DGI_1115 [Megalodesulfovibrio gigas DSM 1382 = ATCC 19364]
MSTLPPASLGHIVKLTAHVGKTADMADAFTLAQGVVPRVAVSLADGLERERFRWPETPDDVLRIQGRELAWLLGGLDFRTARGIKP